MKLSVIVPAYNAEATLPALLDSLSTQSYKDYEIVVVDDFSRDRTPRIARDYQCRLIALSENHGPAYCRNIGVKNASGEILVFTDSDCIVDYCWLANIYKCFLNNNVAAIMGRLAIMPSNLLGDSISALGFPAGGAIGFDKIWHVDQNGFTESFSTCNSAVKKDIFEKVGGFDDSFPFPGGEDSLLAFNLRRAGYLIKYCPDAIVHHRARDSFADFVKWQFKRGISSYIFSTKVSGKKDFLSLRAWSTKNILRHYCRDKKMPVIVMLLCTSIVLQFAGYVYGRYQGGFLCES